jgi:hypothetical protein
MVFLGVEDRNVKGDVSAKPRNFREALAAFVLKNVIAGLIIPFVTKVSHTSWWQSINEFSSASSK